MIILDEVGELTRPEDVAASIASGCELGIIARSAIDPVCLGSKLLVDERSPALGADEAGLMPMLLLIRQVLQNGKLWCDETWDT